MLSNEEFRTKYMHQYFPDKYWYQITKEELENLTSDITKEFYNEWHNRWLDTPADRRIIEDELTYGQYRTHVALSMKYGIGYYKHTPVERARICKLWERDDNDVYEQVNKDWDDIESRVDNMLDQRLQFYEKRMLDLVKAEIKRQESKWKSCG